jgi:hypothetical protein
MGHEENSGSSAQLRLSIRKVSSFLIIFCVNSIVVWLAIVFLHTQMQQNSEALAHIETTGYVPLARAVTKDDLDQIREDIERLEKMEQELERHLEFDDEKLEIQKQRK